MSRKSDQRHSPLTRKVIGPVRIAEIVSTRAQSRLNSRRKSGALDRFKIKDWDATRAQQAGLWFLLYLAL